MPDSDTPLVPETVTPAPGPLPIVSLEQEEQKPKGAKAAGAVSFWFGEIGKIPFDDGTSYMVARNREVITDKKVIANLRKKAKDEPSYKITEES